MHILRGHDGPLLCLAYSPDGSELASGGEDGYLLIWDVVNGKERLARQDVQSAIQGLTYSPDGRWLASGGPRGNLVLRDSTDARPLKRYGSAPTGRYVPGGRVNGLAFAPGGRFLALADGATRAVIWDPDDERYLSLIGAGAIWCVGCDAEGESMAFGSETHLLITPGLRSGAFSGWTDASGDFHGEYLLDINFRECCRSRLNRPAPTRAVAFSPDGRTLASASGRAVDLWDPVEGQLRTTLAGHDDEVFGLAFGPDGRTLASASADGTVRTWDADDGHPRGCYDWEIGAVHCVAFAPDGMTIAAGGDSGLVIWDADEPS